MVLSTKKKILSLTATLLTATILLSGTFAWQSLNQEALNYVRGGANPGGRLHDDFNNITDEIDADVKTYNKDVYVENFTSNANDGVNIYARIRLEEFMAIGENAGPDSKLGDTGITEVLNQEIFVPGTSSDFRQYWDLSWAEGGSTVYLPTFNKNKDSLLADINGTSDNDFADYTKYVLDAAEGTAAKEGYVIQDKDDNTDDELTNAAHLKDLIAKGQSSTFYSTYSDHIKVSAEPVTHSAKQTLTAGKSMSVSQWLAMVKEDGAYDQSAHGNYWVYDTDGWFYWTAPIAPGTATGLLLDQIQRTTKAIDGQWYYELNVVGQFITADDLGDKEARTGFYNTEKGAAPTANALELLQTIGVDTTGETGTAAQMLPQTEWVEVSDEAELRAAMELGGKITLADDIELSRTIRVGQETTIDLDSCAVTAAADFRGDTLFAVDEDTWLDFDGRGVLQAPEKGYVVSVEEGSLLYIWDGTYVGGEGVLLVENGTAVIVDGTFYLQDDTAGQIIQWAQRGRGAVTVYGGTFYNFDPSDTDGGDLLDVECTVEIERDGADTVYTVVLDTADDDLTASEPEETLPDDDMSETELEGGEVIQMPDPDDADGAEPDSGEQEDENLPQSPEVDQETDDTPSGTTGNGISGKADVIPEPDSGDSEADDALPPADTADPAADSEPGEN